MQSPAWGIPVLIWLLLINLWAGSVSFRVHRGRRRYRKEQEAANEREKKTQIKTLEGRYLALRASWASGEIDDLQFDNKLTELVQKGFELPDRDIFK